MSNIKALSVSEVADRLGYGKDHVYKLIKTGSLPAINLSAGTKQARFKVDSNDLETFIASRKNG